MNLPLLTHLQFAMRRLLETRNVAPPEPDPGAQQLFDYRGRQPLDFKGPGRLRTPTEVVAVCVHQTGVEFGGKPRHVRESGETEAHHRRFWSTEPGCGAPYHIVGTRTCLTLLVSDVLVYRYHGDRASGASIGVAVEGRFPGFASGRTPKHTTCTDERIEAWRESLRVAIRLGLEASCPLRWLWAHRQFDGGKPGDPGEEIMRLVAMPVAHEYGLKPQPKMTRAPLRGKAGLAIPDQWLAETGEENVA